MITAWMIWFIIAVLCIIIEIFTPSFYFLAFGIGGIIAGVLSFLRVGTPIQIIVFALTSFLFFLWLRKYSEKFFKPSSDKTNVYGIIGKTGTVTKEIGSVNKGYVKIMGDEWSALSDSENTFQVGSRVQVTKMEGNTVIVSAAKTKEV